MDSKLERACAVVKSHKNYLSSAVLYGFTCGKKKQFSLKLTHTQSNPLIAVKTAFKTIYEGNGELVNTG